jgi:localization factor PodJL
MPAPGIDETQEHQAPPGRGDRHDVDALLDMRERLDQLGYLVAQLRDGLPERQADTLARIEQGIASLALRIADGGHGKAPAGAQAASAPAAPDADEPWDAQSAEALMLAYEQAMAEASSAEVRPREMYRPQPALPGAAEARGAPADAHIDRPWLEARFAGLSALIGHALANMAPARSLAALDRRLDAFEKRLDAALGDKAAWSGREDLSAVEAHIKELAAHLEGVCGQLARLDEMDAHLRDLKQAYEEWRRQSQVGPPPLSEDAVAALIEGAAERAAARVATAGAEDEGQRRIEALEGLLHDYIAERRRGEEATGGALASIEGSLTRIAERVDAMEAARAEPALAADEEDRERDGIELESERLAEAYAAGARALGVEASETLLDATDYAARSAGTAATLAAPLPADGGQAGPPTDDQTARQELRASALRAKLKAEGALREAGAAGASLDEAKASMLGDGRPGAPGRARSHRFSLLVCGAMALLSAASFVAVDRLLSHASPGGDGTPTASVRSPAVVEVPKGTAGIAEQRRGDPVRVEDHEKASTAPAAPRDAPESTTDEPRSGQAEPLRRLSRLQTAATGEAAAAVTAVLGPQRSPEEAGATQSAGRLPPAAMGTAELRSAAAAGDAQAQLEIATRFAQGRDVPQDQAQAFSWYERAATRGLAPAQFRLAAYYERGIGVPADPSRARVWYQRAAEQGHARAMHNLAMLSVAGGGADADYATAAHWFRQAAERGLGDSQFNLGVLYETGRGVARDLQEAYKWYTLAGRSGDPAAARRLEQIKARMEPSAIATAERSAAAWQPAAPASADPVVESGR